MEVLKLTYGCVFYFPARVTPYTRQAKRLLGVDQDLGSISPLSRGTNIFHSESVASYSLRCSRPTHS